VLESLHRLQHHADLLFGDEPLVEYIKAKPQGNPYEVEFTEYRFIPYFLGYFGDQQPGGITSYINGGDSQLVYWFIGLLVYWFIGQHMPANLRLTNKQVNK